MRSILKSILTFLAKLTLLRYKPQIVAITGSVGKTSTKEAVALVLSSKFRIRQTPNNYNNEYGVPLAIIGEESAGKNVLLWAVIFVKSVFKLIGMPYPQVLVLEFGTDRPGDINHLVNLVEKVDCAIITDIGISHLEFFTHPQELAKEKLSLIKKLPNASTAILNLDNAKINEGKSQTKAQVVGFGFAEGAQVLISDFQIINSEGVVGANFKIHNHGNVVPFFLPGALGKPQAYAAAAAASVGLEFNINLADASEALRKFNSPPGRLRLIEGIKHTRIIDDTYNAAPDSVNAALEVLQNIATGRKLAALGDMAELGSKTESGHREIAGKILEAAVDVLILVGPKTKDTQRELTKRNFRGKIFWYENSDLAGIPIQNTLLEGDTIMVKGSRSQKMELIVEEIMANPPL